MLTERERTGCMAILSKLDDVDIFTLSGTVTNKQIKVDCRSDAASAILMYSESARDFLKRKKVAREFLFTYLVDNSVVISANAEKYQLIERILEFWRSETNEHVLYLQDASDTSMTSQSICVTPEGNQQTITTQLQPDLGVTALTELLPLAETFLKWFYPLLNSNNPKLDQAAQDFGAHHFYDEAIFHLSCATSESNSETFTGSNLVAQRLLALVKEEMIIFNPNISKEGVRCTSNPHGLVIVMTCGTIHRDNSCLGTFEQMFGLVKDPRFENNWKIKLSKLRITSRNVTQMPQLTDNAEAEMSALVQK